MAETPKNVKIYPARESWTGIEIHDDAPAAHLDLWLATSFDGFARLSVGSRSRRNGLAAPAPRWSGAALHDDESLAYLVSRPYGDRTHELGIVALGPDRSMADHTADLLNEWNRERRPDQPAINAYPAGTRDGMTGFGHRIDRPDTRLVIMW